MFLNSMHDDSTIHINGKFELRGIIGYHYSVFSTLHHDDRNIKFYFRVYLLKAVASTISGDCLHCSRNF